jgi:hypothetical protein
MTVVLLVGIQLYQSTSAQPASTNATSNATTELGNATNATNNAAIQLKNATSALTDITKSLQQNNSNIPPGKVNTTTIVNSIFDSKLPALFIIVIFLVIIIPLVFDMYIAYRRRPREGTGKGEDKRTQGMPGLYRSLMCFGVILLVGTVIFYLLALITLNINNTNTSVLQSLVDLLKNLGTILGTALATIIAFYFGMRGAESAFTTGSGTGSGAATGSGTGTGAATGSGTGTGAATGSGTGSGTGTGAATGSGTGSGSGDQGEGT